MLARRRVPTMLSPACNYTPYTKFYKRLLSDDYSLPLLVAEEVYPTTRILSPAPLTAEKCDQPHAPTHLPSHEEIEMEKHSSPPPSSSPLRVENNPMPGASHDHNRNREALTDKLRRPKQRTPSPIKNWEDSLADITIFYFESTFTEVTNLNLAQML
ncbi:unnamed protein product, partial [Brenthis ino]